jgi:predicted transcriptional regulator
MPKTVTLVLDDELAQRLEQFAADSGHDLTSALDHGLRAFLQMEERARQASQAVIAAAREGQEAAAPGQVLDDEAMRLWLLSWGAEDERKRPRSC